METRVFHVHLNPPLESASNKVDKVKLHIIKSYKDYPTFAPPNFKNINEITEPFCLIIFLLKVFGNCSISYETIFTGQKYPRQKIRFHVNYFSPSTIFAGIVASLSIFVWFLFLINFGMDTPFLLDGIVSHSEFDAQLKEEASSGSPLTGMVKRTYLISSGLLIIETISRWRQAHKFIHFLSRWETFEKMMAENFPHYDYDYNFSSLTKFRDNLLLFYVMYPSMIFIPAFLTIYASRLNFFAKFLAVIICTGFIGVSLLEDVKIILSYKAIQQAFYQVRLLVSYHSKQNEGMTGDKAYSWRKLIQYIRSQAELAGHYQKFQELTRMVGFIALITIYIFMILTGWDHAKQRGDMLFVLSFCGYSAMLMTRIYVKAIIAENITHEEYHLAKVILDMDSRNWDSRTILEIKTLVDTIALKPACICFGNYVVLNKRLILGISSQIVSYLIVLMQFSSQSNND